MVMEAVTQSPEERLRRLGIELPKAPKPLGVYEETVLSSNVLYITAMIPTLNGVPQFEGRIGENLTVEDGYAATRLSTLNALAAARAHLGSLDVVTKVLKTGVYLVATDQLTKQFPKIADGASELLHEVFGEAGLSVRRVMGLANIPVGVPAMVELLLEVKPTSATESLQSLQ
jgi:enamine deaminase RidA (YjgF/YER057c/UK114 family)